MPDLYRKDLISSLSLVSGPAVNAVDDISVYDTLRLDVSGSPAVPADKYLTDAITLAAIQYMDGADGVLGRALITQTWQLKLSGFPYRPTINSYQRSAIQLPLPPLQSVSSITYVSQGGSSVVLDPTEYQVVNRASLPSEIVPTYSKNWPDYREQPDAVIVEFIAGYGDTPDDIPKPLTSAILLMISDLYDNRSAKIVGVPAIENKTFQSLISPFRTWI